MPSFPPTMSEEKMQAEEAELAEQDLFQYRGSLYYRHEGGMVVTDTISNIAHGRQAKLLRVVEAVPDGAEPYDLPDGSAREFRTDAWTNRVDAMLRRVAFA
jgi:hypothetical protein